MALITGQSWERIHGDKFLKEKSKGYKLCVLTRLEFSLSEICSLLGMSSQALNVMRRRLSVKCFADQRGRFFVITFFRESFGVNEIFSIFANGYDLSNNNQ